jgi:hypothetical protein
MPRISSLLRTTHCVIRGALLPGLLALQICQGAVTYEIATFDVPGYEGATVLVGMNHLGKWSAALDLGGRRQASFHSTLVSSLRSRFPVHTDCRRRYQR